MRGSDMRGSDMRGSTVIHLLESIFKWMLNSLVDMLLHKTNLYRWNKSITHKCPLCNEKQTLMHVLNHCSNTYSQDRYNWWHNEVLCVIADFLQAKLCKDFSLDCNLKGYQYNFLLGTFGCVLRPALRLWPVFQESFL